MRRSLLSVLSIGVLMLTAGVALANGRPPVPPPKPPPTNSSNLSTTVAGTTAAAAAILAGVWAVRRNRP
jgi:hypothetical protein